MKIKFLLHRGFLLGSLFLFALVACVPSNNQSTTLSKKLAPISEPSKVTAVPSHPLKTTAKAPPPRKKLFFFTASYEDVWERIRGDFRLEHEPHNPRVETHIRWFQKHPEYVERVTQRASPYIYLIVEELERRNMPKEVALLPMVESAFNPLAYSPAHASGLWQMIPGTAKGYGLHMDDYYDGRRDIYAATNGALDYLTKLSHDFDGDWLLVFAAYNTGEGNVQRSLGNNRRSRLGTDFWSLKVHNETHEYVPRLLALCHVIKHAEKYGITLPKVDNKPQVQMVNVGRQINLDLAAELAGMSLLELKQYNPGYKSWATSPAGPHHLLLPHESARKFTANLAALPDVHHFGITKNTPSKKKKPPTSPSSNKIKKNLMYIVKPGDTLWSISKKHNLSPTQLAASNAIPINKSLKVGQKLSINTATKDLPTIAKKNEPSLDKVAINKKSSSENLPAKNLSATEKKSVVPKDTIKKSMVSVEKNTNKKIIAKSDKSQMAKKNTNKKITYLVKQGDSVFKIAKQFGVTQNDLVKWNKIPQDKKLKTGQKLLIFAKV